VRSAQKQVIPRTGHGDVREPTLLLPLARAPGRDEVVQRTGEVLLRRGLVSTPAKGGEPVGIAAELVRKNAEPEPSACVFGPGRQLILDQSDDGHGIPFEALRSMDREQLHDIVLRRLGARRELIETLGMVEPGEKAGQRPALVGRQKAVQLVDEGAQLVAGHPRRTARLVRGELDIQRSSSSIIRTSSGSAVSRADAGWRRRPPPRAGVRAAAVKSLSQPWSAP
jgi:hypothetical protein